MSSNPPPCVAWAEKLALRQEDLSPADQATLAAHVQTCPACQAAQADYHFLDARLRALPPPALKPLPRLSPAFAWRNDAANNEVDAGRRLEPARRPTYSTPAARTGPFPSLLMKAFSGVLVACLVLALLLLFGTRTIDTTLARPLGTTFFVYGGHSDFVSAVAWSPNGRYIASGSWDHTVQVWNVDTGVLSFTYSYDEIVNTLAWSPDGRYIAVGGSNRWIDVLNAKKGNLVLTYYGHDNVVNTLAWSPDSRYIASGDRDHIVQVWNAKTGRLLFTYKGHTNEVWALAWSPDGRYIASGSWDHTVQVWQAKTGSILVTYRDIAITWMPSPGLQMVASLPRAVGITPCRSGRPPTANHECVTLLHQADLLLSRYASALCRFIALLINAICVRACG